MSAAGIAIDVGAGKMYRIDQDTTIIKRSDLDGGDVEAILPDRFSPISLALVLPPAGVAPAVSSWGLPVIVLAMVAAGSVLIRRSGRVGSI